MVAFSLLFFLLNLLPVSGLVPIAVFRADRYLYIPSLGILLAGLAAVAWLFRMYPWPATGRAICCQWGSGAASDGGDLFQPLPRLARPGYTLAKSSRGPHGNYQFNHFGLANAYYRRGMFKQAKQAYSNANRFRDNLMCHYYLGRIEYAQGDSTAGRRHFEIVERMFEPQMTGQLREMREVYSRLGRREALAGITRKTCC